MMSVRGRTNTYMVHNVCARIHPKCWMSCGRLRSQARKPPVNCPHLDKAVEVRRRMGNRRRYM